MGLFNKKKVVEDPYNGGYRLIEHDFVGDEIAYKYPVENFYSGSVVFVKPGQQVLFVLDEHVELISREGRYVLDTKNVEPKFRFFIKKHENQDIFHCYLYFINKEKAITCYWGTPNPIPVDSEKYKSTLDVVANGSYTLIVDDAVELLKTTLGQVRYYTAEDIDEFIFNEVIQIIVSIISNALQNEGVVFSKLSSETFNLSKKITSMLQAEQVFERYGFKLKGPVAINTLKLTDADMKKVKEVDDELRQLELEKTKIVGYGEAESKAAYSKGHAENTLFYERGMAEAEIMKSKGAFYAQERAYDVLQAAAQNEGGGGGMLGGNMINSGISLGVGVGLGQGIGRAMGDVAQTSFTNVTQAASINNISCPQCGVLNENTSKFCKSCGSQLIKTNHCVSCQQEIPAESAFCPKCGAPQKAEKICPQCGEKNEASSAFCKKCGNKF